MPLARARHCWPCLVPRSPGCLSTTTLRSQCSLQRYLVETFPEKHWKFPKMLSLRLIELAIPMLGDITIADTSAGEMHHKALKVGYRNSNKHADTREQQVRSAACLEGVTSPTGAGCPGAQDEGNVTAVLGGPSLHSLWDTCGGKMRQRWRSSSSWRRVLEAGASVW